MRIVLRLGIRSDHSFLRWLRWPTSPTRRSQCHPALGLLPEIARLEELRLAALEDRITAELELHPGGGPHVPQARTSLCRTVRPLLHPRPYPCRRYPVVSHGAERRSREGCFGPPAEARPPKPHLTVDRSPRSGSPGRPASRRAPRETGVVDIRDATTGESMLPFTGQQRGRGMHRLMATTLGPPGADVRTLGGDRGRLAGENRRRSEAFSEQPKT